MSVRKRKRTDVFRPSTFLDTLYYEYYLKFEHERTKNTKADNYKYSNDWIIEKEALYYVNKELTFTKSENVLNHFKLLRYIVLHYCNSLNSTSLKNYFEFLKSVLFISLEQEGISLDHYVPEGGELYKRLSDAHYMIDTTPIFEEDYSIKISNTRVHQFLELAKCSEKRTTESSTELSTEPTTELSTEPSTYEPSTDKQTTTRRRLEGGKKFSKKKKHKKFKNNINNNSFI